MPNHMKLFNGGWMPVIPSRTQQMPPAVVHQQLPLICCMRSICIQCQNTSVNFTYDNCSWSIFCILTIHLWKWKMCAKWNANVLSTFHFQHWQREKDIFFDCVLMVDKSQAQSLYLELNQQSNESSSPFDHGKRLHDAVRMFWKWCMPCFSPVRGLCLTILCILYHC
jgi:hypothetical protein